MIKQPSLIGNSPEAQKINKYLFELVGELNFQLEDSNNKIAELTKRIENLEKNLKKG